MMILMDVFFLVVIGLSIYSIIRSRQDISKMREVQRSLREMREKQGL